MASGKVKSDFKAQGVLLGEESTITADGTAITFSSIQDKNFIVVACLLGSNPNWIATSIAPISLILGTNVWLQAIAYENSSNIISGTFKLTSYTSGMIRLVASSGWTGMPKKIAVYAC